MSSELDLCPFCGGIAYNTREVLPNMDMVIIDYIKCSGCGVRKSTREKWNTRATAQHPAVEARNAALEEAAKVVEANVQTMSDPRIMMPRRGGNQYGLEYAVAIRALITSQTPAETTNKEKS